ncbi:hypothetical protein PTTG_08437 [Puccinia triticina 1-1 BBBD Race 1]|uniref:Uncharacterized protein n=2 Tax=Puccinia triticina TaxID=208348 RepID=A0A180G1Y4_PUCT1|nr:uncharacterized protein PtA15_7A544 [Puccinia triticina]OAV86716.1 hypothetical protein PTTG_08437 [Puccinia triticina 1-1 BBBD Race 1]WAQ86815.1 hypothetical protein PtA15_7A544 [Puccinia triticina]WAR56683.1 hypothetical protein PtB15_7B533 [Puccinia triticina]
MVQAGDETAIDRRCFSTWLNPVFAESCYESLWSAAREIHAISSNRSSPTEVDSEAEDANELDPWEKSYGLNWLTRLLSFAIRQTSSGTDEHHDWESLSSLVGQVMAQMTGSPDCPAQSFLRRYNFDLLLPGLVPQPHDCRNSAVNTQIKIQIREGSLSFSAIGSQTWNSAPLLCRRLSREPFDFFPQLRCTPAEIFPINSPAPSKNITRTRNSLKVLELGSGTGLVGLTASQILASILSSFSSMEPTDVEVILTDYHPEVLDNLRHNLELNRPRHTLPAGCPSTLNVNVMKLDWRELESSELTHAGLAGAFDVVLGSDLVYEPEHAVWASNAVRYFLKSETRGVENLEAINNERVFSWKDSWPSFHLLLPLRPTFVKESEAVHQVFGGSDMNLLLDQTDQVPGILPTHSCEWELSTNSSFEKITRTSNARSLQITKYSKEEGVQFGQGCGEYQYLQIRWND